MSCTLERDDGYRGIWYYCNGLAGPLKYKYSGGLGTYCAKHIPLAIHAPQVNRTFFCYGGRPAEANRLLHMVGCFDHGSRQFSRPRILLDKQTSDGHDNVVILLDEAGYVYLFSSSHGVQRPAYISRSTQPYSIDAFERIYDRNYSYPQPWWVPGRGCLWLHTLYEQGRRLLHWSASPDARRWDGPHRLAAIENGHYQISTCGGQTVATAFNAHPTPAGANYRTNLYYLQTTDFGATWTTITGRPAALPLTEFDNPALIQDFRADGLLVYLKDIHFDEAGRPVVLVVTTRSWQPGPENAPRTWTTVAWNGAAWEVRGRIESDSAYDTGCLHIGPDGTWTIIGPTDDGPQPFNPGGEMVMWKSTDRGASWTRARQITSTSDYNHTYARRPVNAHPDFMALWADGHGRRESDSRLYICDATGQACRLPTRMTDEWAPADPVG